jgi:hypothetical protein
MDQDVVEVLHQIDIPGGDPRWPASVRVEKRTVRRNGDQPRTYINLLIAVGQKSIYLPRRAAAAVGAAVLECSPIASQAYTELLEDQNLPKGGKLPR